MPKKDKTDISYSIFDNPSEHNDAAEKPLSKTKKRVVLLVALVLLVGLLIAATLLADKFLPEKESDSSSENSLTTISVITTDTANFKKITINDADSSLVLYSEKEILEDKSEEIHWYAEGYEKTDIGSSLYTALNSAADITAISEITKKSFSECGLDTPQMKITVETYDDKGYTVLIGNASPDGLGVYLSLEGKEKIYLCDKDLIDDFTIDIDGILAAYRQQA